MNDSTSLSSTVPELPLVARGKVRDIYDLDDALLIVATDRIAVNVVVMVLVFYLLNCRSLTDSMFAVDVFSNLWIYAGIASMVAAQLLFTYAPIMNRLFHTAPISGQAWLRILAVAVAGYALVGIEKWIRRRWAKAREGVKSSLPLNRSTTGRSS